MSLSSVPDILDDIRAGKMVILMDDEDRENEGDLIIAAEAVTPEVITFFSSEACGLICMPITDERARQLQLPLMVRDTENEAEFLFLRPRDIATREAFENAITVVIALGGSTNAVLHLLAIAHTAGVKLELDDFTRIGAKVPVLADVKPSGKYLMSELIAIGGIQPLMKTLLDAGLLHGDCMTVTGKTMAQNLADVKPYPVDQDIVRPLDNPIKKDSHLVVLYGNLAPTGAVAKISGKEGLSFKGTARVFHSEEEALAWLRE